jgi:hypothetical protein
MLESSVPYSHVLRASDSSVSDFRALCQFIDGLGGEKNHSGVSGCYGKIEFESDAGILMDAARAKTRVNECHRQGCQFVDALTLGAFLIERKP